MSKYVNTKLQALPTESKGTADTVEPPQEKLNSLMGLYQNGRYDDAEKLARSISQIFPRHNFSWKILGAVLAARGRDSEAVAVYQTAVALSPADPEAQNALGVALKGLGRLDEALASYNQAIVLKPHFTEAHSNLGNTLKELGRLDEAEVSCRHAIALKPDYAKAHGNLGNALKELGRLDEAEVSCRQAIALKPDYTEAHSYLGNTLQELGRLAEAETSYNQAIALNPNYAEAYNNLGNMLNALRRLDEAEASLAKAIALNPNYAEAHNNLGNTFNALGRLEEALTSYNRAIALKPHLAEAHSNLGNTLRELGRLEEAEASLTQAIALKIDYAEAHSDLGNILKGLGRLGEAEVRYKQSLALKPDYAEGYNNLGNALQDLGRLDEAEASYNQAIVLQPDLAEAHSNLGNTLQDLGRLDEAEASYNQAIALQPDLAEAHCNLGNTLKELGRLDEAEASYYQAMKLKPAYAIARSNLLFLNASMRFDARRYLTEARSFADVVAKQISSPHSTWSCSKSPTQLRVGFVSGDFKSHPVGYFLEGLLAQLRSSSIGLYAYSTNNPVGSFTDRLKDLFHSWKSLVGKSDKDAAQMIHKDGVHVLIDLSGHTRENRLAVFGWRPAPIQITWLGYFASTGLPEMDYILGDPFVTPISESHHFTEKIWQLPESFLCFTPPSRDLVVNSLPALSNRFITFGCFNQLRKMTDEVVSVRAKILHALPDSKLLLNTRQLRSQSGRDRVLSRFAAQGISSDRLLLECTTGREEYLSSYSRVDIALSPFPYGGGTTSVEALWMGVPVVAKKGDYFLSHLGESIAYNTGLHDWIAHDNDDYIARTIKHSSDLNALADLRQGLRENLLRTPLYDLPRFANNFEQALWKMKDLIDR